jgi:hypothetical protein
MFRDEDRDQYLFHYTRLRTTIERILPKLSLRFSRYSNMRDPRETQWAFAASFFGDIPDVDELFWRIQSRLQELKSSARLLSCTEDDRVVPELHDQVFSRGFAHPRLWEQYADDHAGVCLVLDKARLIDVVTRAADPLGTLKHDSVTYRDSAIAIEASGVDLNAISKRGLDEVLAEHLDQHADELFFTKLGDWATEVEYRFLLRRDAEEELYVDISDALKGVIVGHAVANEYGPTLRALCDPHGVELAQMHWRNGQPVPTPFATR